MSDTHETDRIAHLLENLDEWIDDSLRKSKPIGLTLCAARSTIADHRARITEMWDALETLRRERDEALMDRANGDMATMTRNHYERLIKERDEAREDVMELQDIKRKHEHEELAAAQENDRLKQERDEAREERDKLQSMRKEVVAANKGAKVNAQVSNSLAGKLNRAERERDEAREQVKELIYIAERAIALAEIDFENDKFGVVSELRDGLERIKEAAK
jgi:chromosome segregation ATPase